MKSKLRRSKLGATRPKSKIINKMRKMSDRLKLRRNKYQLSKKMEKLNPTLIV